MKKKLIPVFFPKKTRKATTKTAPASAAYAPPFTLFKTVHYICAEKSDICAHNTITFALILSR
jgi:hypothetical protein